MIFKITLGFRGAPEDKLTWGKVFPAGYKAKNSAQQGQKASAQNNGFHYLSCFKFLNRSTVNGKPNTRCDLATNAVFCLIHSLNLKGSQHTESREGWMRKFVQLDSAGKLGLLYK